jgi:hypothetical protein
MSGAETMTTEIPSSLSINTRQFHRMVFIINALEKGWSVKKRGAEYTFSKKHEGKREVFQENYLETFIHSNLDLSILNK